MNWKKRYRRLEDRVLLDAAGVVTVVDSADNTDTADAQADSRAEHQQEQDELTSLVAALGESQEQAEQAQPEDSGPEILFVDSQVEDIDQLLQNLDDNIEVFFIDPDEDGAAYIADVLENSDKTYSAIHIVSHGGSGELRLGNTTLTTESLEGETLGHVQAWGDNLTENGDILIYGCSVAEGEDGLAFVEQLADVTGADIAASVDDTGTAALGGDWDLEVSAGDVEADLAIAEPAQVSWGHVLDLTVQDRAALGGGAAADQAIADGLSPDGSGVNISSITYLGGDESIGLFTDLSAGPTGNLLSEGVVISTGFANNLIGDGTAGNTISDDATGPGGAGEADDDADLNTSSINAGIDFDQYDIATFEFSFTPAPGVTKLALNYVFATEETQAFANGQYPDVFGIYVRNAEVGQSYQEFVFTNLRVLHATAPAAGGLFDNSATDTTGNVESNFVTGVQSALLDITTLPGSDSEYTVKFAVADHSDTQLDSAGFFDWLGSSVRLDIDGDDSSGATGLDYDTDFDISTGTEIAVVDVGDVTLINYDSTTTLQTATVRLTNATGSDTLAIDTTGLANIDSTSIDTSVPGEITLTIDFDDTATTEADVIAALAAVTYDNTDGLAINPADRSIEVVVNDGVTDSSAATATVAITGFMDVPTVTGQVTTSLQPTITGSFDEADSDTLVVVVDGTTYTWSNLRGGGTPPAGLSSDGSGNWTLDLAAAGQTLSSDGTFDIEVTTSNDAGSISDASTDELVVDATGPADPTVTALATSLSNPTITGTYDNSDGTVTQVVVNGITYLAAGPDLTVNANGTWSLTIPGGDDLSPGTYDVQVTAEDPVGNPTVVTSVGALEVLAPGAIAAANDANTVGEDGPTLVVAADGVLANDLFVVPDPSRPAVETDGADVSELYLNYDASQDTDNDGDWDDQQVNGVGNLDLSWEWGTNLAPITVSSDTAPSITHAFEFDGSVQGDWSGGLDGSVSENSATFEFWLKVDSGLTTGTNYTIFESGDNADGFTLAYRPTATGNGEFVVYYNDDDLNSAASTGTSVLSLGTAAGFDPTADFMQVVLSFDEPSNAILWHINGQSAAAAGLTVTTTVTDIDDWGRTGGTRDGLGGAEGQQGGSTGTGIGTVANFEGQMAIMRLYGYESGGAARPEPLTDAQILSNYNAVAQTLTASVSAVNGVAGNVGNPVTTVNGGIFTINSDGSYSYDPNGAFESLAPGDTASDSVTYTIDNGLSTDTATLEITITGANDAPTLTGDLAATVDEGAAYVLTGSDLGYTDVDDIDAGITFTVSNLVNGTVQVGGSPVTSFTATQLNAGQVSFVHDGSETLAASFDVNVDDGNEDGSTPTDSTFNLTVNPVNDPPVLAVNNGLNVVNAGSGTITVVLLETTDADDSAADITYTVTSLPANGTLLINGAAAAVNDTFTQAEVNAGQVTYTHDGTPTTTDSFGFDVDDGDEDGSGAISDTFAISIVVDGVAPLAPTIDLLASSDTGSSSSDDFTSDNTPTFRVTFDQSGPVNQDVAAGDTVQLYIDGAPFGAPFAVSPTDVSNGFIDITTIALPDGTANYSVTITDQVGNESPASAALPVQIKTDGPAIPTVNSQATANTTPTITGGFDDVNTDTLEVTFDGVTYTPSDPELSVSGSTWSLAVPAPLADGTYEVSVTTTDEFGIASTDTSSGELVINTSDNLVLSDDTLTVDEASTGSGNLLTNDIITTADPTPPPGEETLDTTDLVSSFDAATDTDGDSVWEDTGSAGLDLTLGSGVTRDTSPTTSLTSITAAYDFDGTGNSTAISSGFPSEVLTEEPAAFEFWLKIDPSVVAGEEYIIIESGDATNGFSLVYEAAADPADGKFIVYFDDQDNGVVATAEIDLGGAIDPTAEFTHLVVRIVDDNAASYIDFFVNGGTGLGGLQASTAVNNLDDWGREDQSIAVGTVSGAQGGSSQSSVTPNNFIGQIASIRIYDETTAGGATIPVSQIENNYLATINADPYVSAITGTSTQTLADPDNGPATSATVTGTGGGQFTVFSDGSYSYDPNGQFESLAPGDTATDTISYTVTAPDGQTETATLTVTVTGLNDPPTLDTNSTLNLDEGTTATITNAFLSASDIDDPASGITYVVDSLPGNGSLLINGVLATVGATFTQDDVDSGLITYVHDGSDTTADSFNFSVDDGDEDGSGATSATFNFSINAIDDTAPTVVADSATLAEGASTTIDLAANDSDSESGLDLASIVITTAPTNGTLSVGTDGTVVYTHDGSDTTSDTFAYTIADNDGNVSSPATVSITVTAVDDGGASATGGDSATTPVNTPVTSTLTVTDPDGLSATPFSIVSPAGDPSNGSVVIDATTGEYTYTPNAGYTGSDSFDVTITDAQGFTSIVTVNITVTAAVDAGPATPGVFNETTAEDTALNGSVGTVTDPDGLAVNPFSIQAVDEPANGTVVINPSTGAYTYTPDADFNGSDSFDVTVTDADGFTSTVTVNITVTAVDDPVTAAADTNTAAEGGSAVTGNVLSNDSLGDTPATVTSAVDDDGDALTLGVAFATDAGGSLTLNSDGSYSYTPPALGLVPAGGVTEVFTYTVEDTDGDSDTATLTITVSNVNQDPVITSGASFSVPEGTTAVGQVVATDSDGDTLNYALSGPDAALFTIDGSGNISFVGAPDFETPADVGSDNTYNVTVSVDDGGPAVTQDLIINVTDVDEGAPSATDDTDSATEGGSAVSGNVLGNDVAADTPITVASAVDDDGDPLTLGVAFPTDAGGSLTLNTDGSYSYTPPALGSVPAGGLTEVFTYTAEDADGDTDIATLTITVNNVNQPPAAVDDDFGSTPEDTAITFAVVDDDTDSDGDTLSVTAIDGTGVISGDTVSVTNGTVTLNGDGTLTFTPAADFSGSISFDYTVSDGALTDTGTVTGTVTPLDDGAASATGGDSATTPVNTAVTSTLTVTDPDGLSATPFSIVSPAGDPSNGSVVIDATTGEYTYTPNAGYTGGDSFDVTITDAQGFTSIVTVNITVTAATDAGPATPGVFNETTPEDTALNGSVGTVTDPDGLSATPFSIQPADQPTSGSVVIDATTGAYTYTPTADFAGSDSFVVTVTDADGFTTPVTVNVTVTPLDDGAATATGGDSATTPVNTAVTSTLTVTDPDGLSAAPFSIVSPAGDPSNGSVVIDATTGEYTYTPNAGYTGGDSFDVTVTDAQGFTSTVTVNITVTAATDAGPATPGVFNETTPENTALNGSVGTVTDPDGLSATPFSIQPVDQPANGTVVIDATSGAYTYTPTAGFSGSDSFDVTVTDADGFTSTVTVNVTVTAAGNSAPTDIALAGSTVPENAAGAIIGTLTTTDPDVGDTHTYSVSDSRFEVNGLGQLKLRAGQSLDFETEPTVTLSITSTDAGGLSRTENFVITVTDVFEDTTPPAQPTVDSQVTSDTTPVITGTSTLLAGEFLEVTVAGTTYTESSPELSLVGSNWSLTLTTPLADGTYEVVARATDAAGNSIADNTSGELVIDTLAPEVPTVDSQVTNEQAPTITGTVNLATGESLAVTVNGVTYTEGDGALNVVGSDWSLVIPAGDALNAGIYDVIARVVDLAGNESLDATSGELEIDLTPPPAPTVVAQVTNDNTPVIAGTVDLAPGDTLTVVVNGVTYTEGDGQLSVTGTNWALVVPDSDRIPDGVYNVTASLEDPAGNVSIDPTSAELEIDTVQAQVPTVESQVTNNDRPTLNGTFDANRADGGLVVTVDGVSYELGVSNALSVSGNSWTLDLSAAAGLDDGTYDVSVDTTDRFGVTVSDNTVGELVIDTIPPGAPTVEELLTRVTSPTLVGTASVGSGETLTVTVDGRTYQEGDGFLNLVGNGWTLNVDGDLADGVYDVTATVADAAGNATSDSTVSELTVDTTAPLVSDLTTSYNERSDEGVPLGSVRVSDNIGLAGVGFLWGDGSVRATSEDGFFTIDATGNIALTTAGAAGMANDFELGDNAYSYTVVATDTVGLESTSSVVLSLLNIDDATPLPDPDGTQGGPLPDEPADDRDPGLGSPGPDDRGEGNADRPGVSDGDRVDIGDTVREITETADQIWNIVDDRVHLDISLDDRPITAEGTSEISLPADTFSHDDPFAEIRVSAEMADGRPLPSYVSFDGNTQTFTVDGAEALAEGVTAIDVRVIGSDDQGQSAEGTFTIEVLGDDFTRPDSVAAGDDAGVSSAGSSSPAGEERGAGAAALESAAAGESGEPLATATAGDDPLVMLTVNLTEQRVGAEGASTIALPSNTFEHSDPEETIYVEATLQDGGSLPEFVIFDPDTMTFDVDGAAAAEAGQTEISVLLVGRDDAGNSASGVFVISVGSLVEETAGGDALLPNEGDASSGDGQGAAVEIDEASNEELLLEENQAASDETTAEQPQKQADGRENLDLQLEKASRYTFVEKLEQLLDDIKNLFT